MRRKASRPFVCFLGCVAGCVATVQYQRVTHGSAKIPEIVENNNLTVQALARIADPQTRLADITMRFSHYTDRHTETRLFCPECASNPIPPPRDVPLEGEALPRTLAQLHEDSREISRGVGSILAGMWTQERALRYTLLRMRSPKGVTKGAALVHLSLP